MDLINISHIVQAIIFAAIGMGVFAFGFWLFDKMTPFSLRKELLEDENTALGIVIGSMSIALSIIIAAAIH